jgi:putative inorganic carbon (HCO3(-)) transporter
MHMQVHSLANRILYAFYLLVLAWAPIPLGSNRVWAWSLLEAAVYLLVAAIVFITVIGGRQFVNQSILNRNRWIIALFGAHLAYLLIQCLPMPIELLALINPVKASWFQYPALVSSPAYASLSASNHHSMVEFYKQLTYVLMLGMTLCLVDTKKRLFTTLSVMIGVSLIEAVYGISARLMGDSFGLWRPTDGDLAGGTFVNKNHFAANLSLSIGLSIGLCLYFLRVVESFSSRGKLRGLFLRTSNLVLTPIGFTFGGLLVLMSGMLLSQSRGALVALCLTIMAFLAVGMMLHGRKSGAVKILPYIFLIALLASFWLGLGNVFSSFADVLTGDTSRWTHWQQTWTMFSQHWFAGVGNGAYQYVFTQFKGGDYTHYLIDYAHNDHLQIFAEQGLAGATLWYAALLLCCVRLLRAYRTQRGSERYQCVLLGCLISLGAFFLHGLVDFNFHIPANALWFYTVLGLGLSLSHRIERGKWLHE